MDQPRFPGFESHQSYAHRSDTTFFPKVFAWMFAGLLLTAIIAFYINSIDGLTLLVVSNPAIWWGAIITEIVIVFVLGLFFNRMSPMVASFCFFLYAAINGVTFSIFLAYFGVETAGVAFLITGGLFGLASLYGFVTKRDITKGYSLVFMAMLGIFLASLVNIFFLKSSLYSLIASYAIVILFTIVTAMDVKQFKMLNENYYMDETGRMKIAIYAAFSLYINFIAILKNLMYILGSDD